MGREHIKANACAGGTASRSVTPENSSAVDSERGQSPRRGPTVKMSGALSRALHQFVQHLLCSTTFPFQCMVSRTDSVNGHELARHHTIQ